MVARLSFERRVKTLTSPVATEMHVRFPCYRAGSCDKLFLTEARSQTRRRHHLLGHIRGMIESHGPGQADRCEPFRSAYISPATVDEKTVDIPNEELFITQLGHLDVKPTNSTESSLEG